MSIKSARRAVLPAAIRYLNKSLRSWRRVNAVARGLGWPSPNGNPLSGSKTSDTLFVLGSGASVLTYSEENWRTIASCDSLGFNYWVLHPFVPSNYLFEMTKDGENLERIVHNLALRQDYRRVTVYVKDIERFASGEVLGQLGGVPAEIGPFHPIWDAEIPAESLEVFSQALVSLNRFGCFSGKGPWAVPRNRATIFLAVNLAVRAGYKAVVLGGVDLNNTDYFFRMPEFAVPPNLHVPPLDQFGRIHKTNDTKYGELTISKLLDALDRAVLQPRGVQLYVAKCSSALYPRFPAYFD
ncbi:MAG: hypothetical protein AB7U30_03570 [Sulfuricellaceae bacterium]|jgi:hypothetical protein